MHMAIRKQAGHANFERSCSLSNYKLLNRNTSRLTPQGQLQPCSFQGSGPKGGVWQTSARVSAQRPQRHGAPLCLGNENRPKTPFFSWHTRKHCGRFNPFSKMTLFLASSPSQKLTVLIPAHLSLYRRDKAKQGGTHSQRAPHFQPGRGRMPSRT